MMLFAAIYQPNLTDPPPTGVFSAAASWISAVLFGPLATTIAIIAIAWIGFAMLSGRIDIRRGLAVVFGCFLLFGAQGVAEGLRESAQESHQVQAGKTPPPPAYANASDQSKKPNGYDPYAGAAIIN